MTQVEPRSVSFDQTEILDWIRQLHCPSGFEVDATFGNGGFYRGEYEWPRYRFDADPALSDCTYAMSDQLPLENNSVGSVVFDPPFLTYVRSGRQGNGKMVMARRFGGYWRYDELEAHYKGSLHEFNRVLRHKGVLVFKCQDIVHNHRLHLTGANVVGWARETGFRVKDQFVLAAKKECRALIAGANRDTRECFTAISWCSRKQQTSPI